MLILVHINKLSISWASLDRNAYFELAENRQKGCLFARKLSRSAAKIAINSYFKNSFLRQKLSIVFFWKVIIVMPLNTFFLYLNYFKIAKNSYFENSLKIVGREKNYYARPLETREWSWTGRKRLLKCSLPTASGPQQPPQYGSRRSRPSIRLHGP